MNGFFKGFFQLIKAEFILYVTLAVLAGFIYLIQLVATL
jgi:hypothetical protein